MDNETLLNDISTIPHGHGLSFKKGVADGLLEKNTFSNCFHDTHQASYNRGVRFGNQLKDMIANQVQ